MAAGREVYEFGEFTLDASERRLSKGDRRIPLAPKEHDVLVALLRNAGRLVGKSELLESIWPQSFVEEGILAVHVSTLRKALRAREGGQRYIETVSWLRRPGSGGSHRESPDPPHSRFPAILRVYI